MPNIMIVDDSEDFRKPVAAALTRRGFRVTGVGNGTEALRLMRDEHFDLVILDMVMPLMDGITVLRTMRKDARLKEMPVIFLTGRDAENVLIDAKSLGAHCLLKYCVTMEELSQRVRERLPVTPGLMS